MNEPTFERCPHDRENPYAQISKELIHDRSISPKAKGVIIYILSLPKDWKIRHSHLQYALNIGEDYLNSAMEELIEAGYAERTREKVKGVFQPYRYKIREFKKCSPNRENRPGSSGPENPAVQSIECTNQDKEIVCIADASGSDKKEEKGIAAPEMQTIRRIEKKNGRGDPISLNWDDLITYATNYKKDWRLTEMREAWKILHDRNGFVNDMIEFLAGTISNLRDKTRAIYANKGKPPCTSQQTIKPKSEMKNSPDTSRSNSENSSEKDIRVNVLDALISLRQQLGQSLDGLPPRRTS